MIALSTGMILKYPIAENNYLEQTAQLTQLKAENAVTSLVMDEQNVEGVFGSTDGNLYYMNITEQQIIKIVSRVASGLDHVA